MRPRPRKPFPASNAQASLLAWGVALLLSCLVMPAWGQVDLSDPLGARRNSGSAAVVKPRLVWSTQQVRPGGQGAAAIVIDIAEHYHINPDKDQILPEYKDQLIPLTVEVTGIPAGVTVGRPQFPKAELVQFGTDTRIPGYEKRVIVYLPVVVAPDYAGDQVTFAAEVGFQSCNDTTCLPPTSRTLQASLPVARGEAASSDLAANPPPMDEASGMSIVELFRHFDSSAYAGIATSGGAGKEVVFKLLKWEWTINDATYVGKTLILVMAVIGGLLLNFTPCVLPVIPIKVLSLKQAAGGWGKQFRLGLAMSLGVIAFWIGLGLAMAISTKLVAAAVDGGGASGGGISSTNQLFQYPWFTISVGTVIIVLAIGMCGLFAVRLPQWVYRINPGHDSYHGSFGFGVMTAVLSTPCTAPFMGSAAAWAVGLDPVLTMSTFLAIGVGMALPYLILSANPKWIDRMPRTGPASELIKQVMGLLLMAAGVFFLGTGISGMLVSPPEPPSRLYWWGVALLVAAAGVWLIWRIMRVGRSPASRGVFSAVGAAMVIAAAVGAWSFTDKGPIDWIYYTPDRLEQAQRQGKVVVLEFTAEWCLNCKLLEQSALATKEVSSLLNSDHVAAIKVDLTGDNEAGNQLLNRLDAVAIPLLVVIAPDGRQVFKADNYTSAQVIEAVSQARGGGVAIDAR